MTKPEFSQEPELRASGPAAPTSGASCRLRPLPLRGGRITGGFWAPRQKANREVAIPAGLERLETAGNLENLRIAAGRATGPVRGPVFMDSDVYKWLEAAAWEQGREPAPDLAEQQHAVTELVGAAQHADGYLDSVAQAREGGRYRDLPSSHEHYCAGHLIQAAVAQVRATGDRGLLDVAVRLADHLTATFGEDGRHDVDGHPIVEMGLAELYRETGEPRYLELARYFVEARGHGLIQRYGKEPTYFSDRVPVRKQTTVEGHAVRAVYLGAGATDVALELNDDQLLDALRAQFAHMLTTKTYITGGLGARWDGESFGDPYELPPDRAYAESCAAIGGIQWAWRLLLATGEPSYADAMERMLFNGFLAGLSLSGAEYFYVNPLQLRSDAHAHEDRSPAHGRRGWFEVACCPPNIMRTLASLGAYLATADDDGLQLQLYAQSEVSASVAGGEVRLAVETSYPWDGRIRISIRAAPPAEWTLGLRVPGWAAGATVSLAGRREPVDPGTYATLRRAWASGDVVELLLPMPVRLTEADARVDAVRGCVAIERGPLVYAVEQVDLAAGLVVDDVRVDPSQPLDAEYRSDLLGGITVVTTRGSGEPHAGGGWPYPPMGAHAGNGTDVVVTAVPYFAWANRSIGPMRVWLPLA